MVNSRLPFAISYNYHQSSKYDYYSQRDRCGELKLVLANGSTYHNYSTRFAYF